MGPLLVEERLKGGSRIERNRMDEREQEIVKELKNLYAELDKFPDPTPSDEPHEYEPEEIEAFESIKERIRILEDELERITGQRL
jgi:hypothetical protein